MGLLFFGMALGWSWSVGWGLWQEPYELSSHREDWTVEGRIASLPTYQGNRVRFVLAVDDMISVQGKPSTVKKLRISWYDFPAETRLIPGQRWRFFIRAFQPHSFINPGGFDYERWMMEEGIQGSGYVRGEASLLAPPRGYFFTRLRLFIRHQIDELDASVESKAIINALMTGDRSYLSDDIRQVLFRTGLSHLIAISGLHVTLIGGLIFFLSLALLNLLPFFRPSPRRLASCFALAVVWFYAFSVGFSIPTQRATLMLSILFVCNIFMHRSQLLFSYALALASVLLVHPLAGFGGGFYLSFAAVAVILLAGRYLFSRRSFLTPAAKVRHYFISLFLLQGVILLCLTPFSVFFFHAFSPLGFFVNLIAIPVTSFLLMPWILATWLFLFAFPKFGRASLDLLTDVVDMLYQPLGRLAAEDWALIQLAQPSLPLMLCVLIGIGIFILQPRPSFSLLGMLFFAPLFFPPSTAPPVGSVQVSFLDVGQGLAVHLRTAAHNLFYDVGPRYSSSFDASDITIPYLHSQGIKKLDRIIISHSDTDHSGGLRGLLQQTDVESLMLNFRRPFMNEYEKIKCTAGTQWQWDDILFQVLHPTADYLLNSKDRNNNSCVLLVSAGEKKLLLTGDIKKEVENQLLRRFGELKISVLQVPHHGSSSSSDLAWIKSLRPDYAVFSAGYGNTFSHPTQEVFNRYVDTERLVTWKTGYTRFEMNAHGTLYKGGRRYKAKRYWYKDIVLH